MKTIRRSGAAISLTFAMTRADNPRLYDDLVQFNMGTKRINRLRFLAHEGLLAQNGMVTTTIAGVPTAFRDGRDGGTAGFDADAAASTNQVFALPVDK
jgi:hypothetical protein